MPARVLRGKCFERGSCCWLSTTQSGAISRLPTKLAASIGQCASGESAGRKSGASRTYPDRELPGAFPPEVRAQTIALACSRPRQKGKPLIRWSAAEIARSLILLGIVACLSASTVGRWLAQDKIRPWCYHTWQHILDPRVFLERARPILQLYERAQALDPSPQAAKIDRAGRARASGSCQPAL